MKRNRYSSLAVAALMAISSGIALSSCEDFLTEDPKGRMVTETFFQTENDLNLAVNALYYNVASSQKNTNPYIPDCQGDDITTTAKTGNEAYQYADEYAETNEYKGVNDLWSTQYNIIQAANLIIDNADKADAPQEVKNVAKGNAYFWRACAYFRLVRVFGPLPVNRHNEPDNNATPLSSVEDVYKLIEEDLANADACGLPASYADDTKYPAYAHIENTNVWISRQAVKSLMCAVYMNMAGYPLFKTEYWKKAADAGYDVYTNCENGTYPNRMEQDWSQVYSYGNNFSAEQIVTISYLDNPGAMGESYNYVSQWIKCHRFAEFKAGWGDFVPERWFWANFPDGPRKRAVYDPMIYVYKTDDNGDPICVDWWATKDKDAYSPDKKNNVIGVFHPMFSAVSINCDNDGNLIAAPYDFSLPQSETMQSAPQNHRFIRVSEVYLWFAESAAMAGEYSAEAAEALRKVMERAYEPGTIPAVTDVAEQAFAEHGYEVAGYPIALCSRRSDLFRKQGKADPTLNRLYDAWLQRVEQQNNPQNFPLVAAGTPTTTYERVNVAQSGRPVYKDMPVTYTTADNLFMAEELQVSPTFDVNYSIYQPYPPTETEKNPNIRR
ncbi:MAG: RagB/SusD family nutrient uptake outer membrane protein [Muribaculaceae bacterium]|nr:RagB/SusD family nutrient uptake outer membrane protein [Muribaculaceae bacterium]